MIKAYVAGKLNDLACDYIKNCHKMIKEARKLRYLGISVYVPCVDLLEGLVDGDFNYDEYFYNSQPWLEASDIVYVCPGYETSQGTLAEIERAKECGIPVFYSTKEVKEYINAIH